MTRVRLIRIVIIIVIAGPDNVNKKVGRRDSTARTNTAKAERFLCTHRVLQEVNFMF